MDVMRVLLVICTLAALGACLRSTSHQCNGAADCPGGACVQPAGACAFPDGSCGSGQRYGDGTGALAGVCVGEEDELDAAAGDPDAAAIDAGPVGHDEDDDGVDDALDNCPHASNSNQRDQGETNAGRPADGVGDACDPDPDRAGNSILLFDSMSDGLVAGRWTSSGVTNNGDALRLEQNGYLISQASLPGRVLLTVGARLGSTTQTFNAITIASNYQDSTSYIGCRRQVTMLNLQIGASAPSTAAPVFSPGQEIWMELLTNNADIECGTSIEGGVWTSVNQPTGSTPLPGGTVVISPLGTFLLVDFLIVISRP